MPLRKALEIELGKYIGQGGENCRQDNLIHGSSIAQTGLKSIQTFLYCSPYRYCFPSFDTAKTVALNLLASNFVLVLYI